MANNPLILFSIVIPTFNRAVFIVETIHSLLSQTYTKFEIIVVDDGSTDNTEAVIKNIKDERVQYHKVKNGERGAARNYGAKIAKGEYINFFDSDDVAYSIHLDTAFKLVNNYNHPEIFHLGYDVVDNERKVVRAVNDLTGDVNLRLFTKGNVFSCNGVFMRKDIAMNHPFIEDRNLAGSEDAVLWMQLACHYKWICNNTITTSIIDHDSRSVVSMNKEKLIGRLNLFVNNVITYPPFVARFSSYSKYIRTEAYTYAALHLAMVGYTKDALLYLFKMYGNDISTFATRRNLACIKRIILSVRVK